MLSYAGYNSQFPINAGISIIMMLTIQRYYEYEQKYFNVEFTKYKCCSIENRYLNYVSQLFQSYCINNTNINCYPCIVVGDSSYIVIENIQTNNKSVDVDASIIGAKISQNFSCLALGKKNKISRFVTGLTENFPYKNKHNTKMSSMNALEHMPVDKQTNIEITRKVCSKALLYLLVSNIRPIFISFPWLPYFVWTKTVGYIRHYKAEALIANFSSKERILNYVVLVYLIKLFQTILPILSPNFPNKDSVIWWTHESLELKITFPPDVNLILLLGMLG
ncbi:MAG: hypothetical protein LBQ98_02095 [Nitrososphaerota archaeon]|nr:hypothetical protein [Nitrososphaerota archaeon]